MGYRLKFLYKIIIIIVKIKQPINIEIETHQHYCCLLGNGHYHLPELLLRLGFLLPLGCVGLNTIGKTRDLPRCFECLSWLDFD